jgi:hypothetical protein
MDAIAVGSIIQTDWDSRPNRILLMDHIEALYDTWWPHTDKWGFSNLDGAGAYYRISASLLRTRSTVLRAEPLTDAELAIHRPDLPLRLLRSSSMQWSETQYKSMTHFIKAHQAEIETLDISDDDVALDAAQVFLTPFGPSGRTKPDVKIRAVNEKHFSSIELLWRAHEVQAPHHRKSTSGIGIYRAGFRSKTPVFYLWGSDDRAGLTTRAEGRETPKPEKSLPEVGQMTYVHRLNRWRKHFPFSEWRTGFERGLEQYTEANCDRAERILNELVDSLIEIEEAAPEAKKVSLFKTAVEALNALDAETQMIETGEREELCELFNLIAVDCGIDPCNYGHGEGLASEWRDW